jgi:uncharacterized membrane protein YeaQ/YmgE (transglycosylase-associated protein family)
VPAIAATGAERQPFTGDARLSARRGREHRMIGFILYLLVVGLIAGFIARALVPGRDPMGLVATIVLGIVGSFIGGFLGWALFGHDLEDGALQASGLIGSIIGAVIALLMYRAFARRSHTSLMQRR